MRKWIGVCLLGRSFAQTVLLVAAAAASANAATIDVPAGGNLQSAINAAQPGDTIRLAPGATYTGNFVLPVHADTSYITIRSAAADSLLPGANVRITPAYSAYLPRIQSPNASPALSLAPGAAYWRLQFLEFLPTSKGHYDIIALGDGSDVQNTMAKVPHHLIVDRVYVHGDPIFGQKRGIGLNSAYTTIINSYISDIKAAGQDSQAIAGWNGPGPHTIENNYLEAAGNVILIGGDDPKIPNLTATNLLFRGNTMTRPLSWRSAVVPTPTGSRLTFATGGSLAAGTYAYRVMARRDLGSSGLGNSAVAAQVSVSVTAGSSITVAWDAVPNAKDYVVYGRTASSMTGYWITTGTTLTDDGSSAGTSGTPPSSGTVWSVKNIFELKNARSVQVDHNLMENNWAQSQNGTAVLFTPRNQYGGCTWCVVEDVTFEYNVVRHVGSGLTITGWDDEHPSQQTNTIRIRNNEFSDYSWSWGGSGYFMLFDNQPRNVTLDHNTLIAGPGGASGMIAMAGAPMSGIVITNNLAVHEDYGLFGSDWGYGKGAIGYYLPGAVIGQNVLAGGAAYEYPAGFLFPSVADFVAHFVDYAGGDFALVPNTNWANAGTDGFDLGADMGNIRGVPPSAPIADPPAIVTTALPSGPEGTLYAASLTVQGGLAPYSWSVLSGVLPPGIQLDPIGGVLSGVPVQPGDSAFTIEVRDAVSKTARKPLALHIDAVVLPVVIATTSLPAAALSIGYSTALAATGGKGAYAWTLTGGALPTGLSLSSTGVISGTPTAAATFAFTVTARDTTDSTRFDSRSYSMTVSGLANVSPLATLQPPPASAPLASTVTLSATASDADGFIARVDFLVDGTVVGTDATAPFTFGWRVTAGSHQVGALAVDNRGGTGQSAVATIAARMEVVLRAGDATKVAGAYQVVADATAADGAALYNTDSNTKAAGSALAAPASYAEFQFYAEAGRAYHLWIRGSAQNNTTSNDSAFVQFSNVNAAPIGSRSALGYQLEDGRSGVANWGWQDDGIANKGGAFGTSVVFTQSGLQTIRLQPRENGLRIDQIVLSPDKYLAASPGVLKNDATIVAK